ncbi:MAG TPA: DUF3365 domain-containing protein [Cyclobacteriaceae bacterium]|nr:DUF3365 domain-containing protein [Cyclobacteriaceae bacterium]
MSLEKQFMNFKQNTSIGILVLLALLTCCAKHEKQTNIEEIENNQYLLQLGDSITKQSFQVIRTALMNAIQAGGLPQAITYCNLAASGLTDSLSQAYHLNISRVSDKYRNKVNEANPFEIEMINAYKSGEKSGEMLTEIEGRKIYYKPIMTQAFCLNCHGTAGKELTEANDELIKTYYPDDHATGYAENEVRGLWKVVFNMKK